jgi:hypothetical protein
VSTQTDTAIRQTVNQQASGPSGLPGWALAVVAALAAAVVAVILTLWHLQPHATPATTGTPTSTFAPAHFDAPRTSSSS